MVYDQPHVGYQTAIVLLAFILVLGVFYLLFTIIAKLAGALLFLIGVWLIIFFPAHQEYQPGQFVTTARIIGLLLVIVGLLVAGIG